MTRTTYINFRDIKKGDRLAFVYKPKGGQWKVRKATAHQDTLLNDYDASHPESNYLNVQWDNPALPYTENWVHINDTVYGPHHITHAHMVDEWVTDSAYEPVGEWCSVYRIEGEEMTNKDEALAKVAEAEKALAEAKALLNKATEPSAEQNIYEQVEKLATGTVFRLQNASGNRTIRYLKSYGGVVDTNGKTRTVRKFSQDLADTYSKFNKVQVELYAD